MPIRKENRNRYPVNWDDISASIRQRAGNKCEDCHVENYALGGRLKGKWMPAFPLGTTHKTASGIEWPRPGDLGWCGTNNGHARLKIIRIVLTVGHLNHKPEDCRPENLKCWCQQCHLRYDAKEKAAGIKSRRRAGNAVGELFAS